MTNQRKLRQIDILLVEDNPGDVRLTREALKEGKVLNSLQVVGDVSKRWNFSDIPARMPKSPHPDIILLDLNLPKKDGREVLADIKSDPNLRRIRWSS